MDRNSYRRLLAALILLAGWQVALGSEHGGGESPAAKPLTFISNLAGSESDTRYLQVALVLEAATLETEQALNVLRPKVQHEILLLLTEQTADALRTLAGKQSLAKKIRAAVNRLLKENEKTGVKEVLYTSFVIQ